MDDANEQSETQSITFSMSGQEEMLEEEMTLTDQSNTQEILDQIVIPHDECAHYDLDMKREEIFRAIRNKIKAGPKPPILEAEEKKIGIERQLEDNSKQLEELIAFGDIILTNIKAIRERADKVKREMLSEKRRELNRRIRQESIEADAQYSMIKDRWLELEVLDDPLDLYKQVETEKKNVDILMASKDKLLEDCQTEIDRLNDLFEEETAQQNKDLSCFGQSVLHQCDLFSKAAEGQIDLLEHAVDDEWNYQSLVSRQRWNELYELVNTNINIIYEIINAKDRLYEKEIRKLIKEQEELTRVTKLRLEKDAAELDSDLRRARFNALMNSEKLDYNYNVLQHRHAEDITLNNQQKRRVAALIEKIGYLKHKIFQFRKQSELKLDKLDSNIDKIHESITELEKKYRQCISLNRKKFIKVWEVEHKEIEETMDAICEIDKIMYRTQLARCWDPFKLEEIELDFGDKKKKKKDPETEKQEDSSSATVELDPERVQIEKIQREKKEKMAELRFLRNIIRKIAGRSKIFFERRLFEQLEDLSESDKFMVYVDNIFRVLKINNMEMVQTLLTFFKPYSYCPNCQKPPTTSIIKKLYKLPMPDPLSEEDKPCDNHVPAVEPLLVLSALREYEETLNIDLTNKISVYIPMDDSWDIEGTVKKIQDYYTRIHQAVSPERIHVWKALKHGLKHFALLLEERMRLHEECLTLSKQNAELKYFIGEGVEIPEIQPRMSGTQC